MWETVVLLENAIVSDSCVRNHEAQGVVTERAVLMIESTSIIHAAGGEKERATITTIFVRVENTSARAKTIAVGTTDQLSTEVPRAVAGEHGVKGRGLARGVARGIRWQRREYRMFPRTVTLALCGCDTSNSALGV